MSMDDLEGENESLPGQDRGLEMQFKTTRLADRGRSQDSSIGRKVPTVREQLSAWMSLLE
jgi:hypothetical protein